MKWGKLLLGVGWACVLYACSDDDGKDDTIMNMSELTGKYWYYNAWLGDKYGMGQSDLLEVIRFEKGGVLKMMEFGGRRVHAIGTWTGGDNQITMDLDDGDSIVWNVQRSGPDYIQTIVNAQGERKYTTDPGYLGELTADAFLVNEYTDGNQFKTYIGVDVRGNKNVKEVALIPADGKSIPVENHGYFWSERQPRKRRKRASTCARISFRKWLSSPANASPKRCATSSKRSSTSSFARATARPTWAASATSASTRPACTSRTAATWKSAIPTPASR